MNLSPTDKASALQLSGLTVKDACQLFVELFYARVKTEAYFVLFAADLSSDEQHNLRKIVTEINIKVLQVFAILRSQLVELFNYRIETTCLLGLLG